MKYTLTHFGSFIKFIKNKFYFSLLIFALLFTKQTFAQSTCPEVFFQNQSSTNSISSFPQIGVTTTNMQSLGSPSDPDSAQYPDAFPDKQYTYKVVFKVIRNNDKVRLTGDVGESEVMDRIRDLNLSFNEFNIFFKYGGIEYIDNTDLIGDRKFIDLMDDFYNPLGSLDAFSIFVLDGDIVTVNPDGTNNNIPGLGYMLGKVCFFNYFGITSTRIVNHEVGHNFYLKHDFTNYGDPISCEHVIRLNQHPTYNAGNTGDWVNDTPATKVWGISEYNITTGFYDGDDIDCNDDPSVPIQLRYYKTGFPKINNFMHWHAGNDLNSGYYFTQGQGKRMRWVIATDITANYGIYSPAEVDVKELYQPFEYDGIAGSAIVSVEDNGDGTASVCRQLVRKDRFQKGFDAEYLYMNNSPIAYSNPDELKEIIGMTGDYKVRINQVNHINTEIVSIPCTRGVICTNEPYVSGILISTEILGSMNITIEQLTKAQVNDPELFNNLMEKYYYILKKQTVSGAEIQKIIYKN